MMRSRRIAVALAAASITIVAVSTSWASTKTIHDPKGDSKKGHADIKSVTAKSSSHAVRWRIGSYTDFATKKSPCVGISPGSSKQPLGDEFELCGNGKIHNFKHGGIAGHAKVQRPNPRTVVYKVKRSVIGDPSSISWAVQVREKSGCFPDICDQAPEGPGRHVVQHL